MISEGAFTPSEVQKCEQLTKRVTNLLICGANMLLEHCGKYLKSSISALYRDNSNKRGPP